jgi:hypothetical protein
MLRARGNSLIILQPYVERNGENCSGHAGSAQEGNLNEGRASLMCRGERSVENAPDACVRGHVVRVYFELGAILSDFADFPCLATIMSLILS